MSEPRQLTPAEQKALGLIQTFDKAAEARQNAITLFAGSHAAEAVQKLHEAGAARVSKVEWDDREKKFAITYRLPEFYKYLTFILKQVGMTLNVDGSLTTFDKLTVSSEYLQ